MMKQLVGKRMFGTFTAKEKKFRNSHIKKERLLQRLGLIYPDK